MKKILNIIGALAVAVSLPLSALAERYVPTIPVMYYGAVTINSAAAPVGTVIDAQTGSGTGIKTFTVKEAGKYYFNISQDDVAIGTVIKFKIDGKVAGETIMVDVNVTPSVKLDLAITKDNSTGGGNGGGNTGGGGGGTNPPVTPGSPATPADTSTKPATPAVPAIPASPAADANGQVKGDTDVSVVDGDIIQCKNSADPNAVYIVKVVGGKKYIRHIVSLQIFNHYKHLKWEKLIQVQSLDGFSLSGWVRVNTGANGTPGANDRVWEINGDQTRHWIDMTAAEFLLHGGSDEAIFSINQGELNLYKEGPAVKLK